MYIIGNYIDCSLKFQTYALEFEAHSVTVKLVSAQYLQYQPQNRNFIVKQINNKSSLLKNN